MDQGSYREGDGVGQVMYRVCALALLSLAGCSQMVVRDRPVALLGTVQLGMSLADSVNTESRKAYWMSRGGYFTEHDPLARPLVNHPPALYAFDLAGAYGTAWLGSRMKHSHNVLGRKLWWLPQVVVISGNTYGLLGTH